MRIRFEAENDEEATQLSGVKGLNAVQHVLIVALGEAPAEFVQLINVGDPMRMRKAMIGPCIFLETQIAAAMVKPQAPKIPNIVTAPANAIPRLPTG